MRDLHVAIKLQRVDLPDFFKTCGVSWKISKRADHYLKWLLVVDADATNRVKCVRAGRGFERAGERQFGDSECLRG